MKKKGGGSRKGSGFEREICTTLSMWYCNRDDTLWRTAGSGGRATVRGRKGKTTLGGSGDVWSTDPMSKPLMDFVTFEVKRGYSKFTPFDMLDKKPKAKKQQWEMWMEQAELSRKNAGSKYWAIISRRNQRDTVIMMPYRMAEELEIEILDIPKIAYTTKLAPKQFVDVLIFRLDDVLKYADKSKIG